jgi:integrase
MIVNSSGEITTLRLEDVDWRKEVIGIRHSKTGAISYLPLLPEVGEAILKYLQDSRPKTSFREMFILTCAPYRPFKAGSSLYMLVRHRLDAANVITRGKRGPHAFRHYLPFRTMSCRRSVAFIFGCFARSSGDIEIGFSAPCGGVGADVELYHRQRSGSLATGPKAHLRRS